MVMFRLDQELGVVSRQNEVWVKVRFRLMLGQIQADDLDLDYGQDKVSVEVGLK